MPPTVARTSPCSSSTTRIYGMTGGQMAPTTLVGQTSTTSPGDAARQRRIAAAHVAEMLATLEAPAYIERVALSRQEEHHEGPQGGEEGAGDPEEWRRLLAGRDSFALPDHHEEGSGGGAQWVAETLMQAFPLGVFRDRKPAELHAGTVPQKTDRRSASKSCGKGKSTFRGPKHHTRDIHDQVRGLRRTGRTAAGPVAGRDGDARETGSELAAVVWSGNAQRQRALPRLAFARAHRLAADHAPEVLVAMNEISLRKFAAQVAPGGTDPLQPRLASGRLLRAAMPA